MGCIQSKRNLIVASGSRVVSKNANSNQEVVSSVSGPLLNKVTMDKTEISNQFPILKLKDSGVSEMIQDSDRDFIISVLQTHFLFKEISSKALYNQQLTFIISHEEPGVVLFKESDITEYFYIIRHGTVQMYSNEYNKELSSKETFGEMALFKKKQQTTSAKCKDKTMLYMLKGTFFRDIVLKMNEKDLKKRLALINSVHLFKQISAIELNTIASSLYKIDYEKNEEIIKEGDSGDSLYIVSKGKVKVCKGNETVRILKEKDCFGEYALLFDKNRSHAIVAKSNKVICYQLCKAMLIDILGKDFRTICFKGILKTALINSQYFKPLSTEEYIMQIYQICNLRTYKANETIPHPLPQQHPNSGDNDNSHRLKLRVLIEGNIIEAGKNNLIASRGDLFGEIYLKKNDKGNYMASTFQTQLECQVLEFEWEQLLSLLNFGVEEEKTLSFLNNLNHLSKISFCKCTSSKRLIELCKLMEKEKYAPNTVIFKEEDKGDKLYLIKKGKVEVTKEGKVIRILEMGNCFGERSLLVNSPRSATIRSITEVTVYTLVKHNFEKIIEGKMTEYLTHKIALQDNFTLELKDLYYCKTLGKGKYGSVSLVHDKCYFYGIKAVNRNLTEKKKELIKYFIEEKKVLLKLDHPFIMKLVKTFKNEQFLFYLMEFINGKTLERCLMNKFLNKSEGIYIIQFIIASLVIILDYLNGKSVCHRDLKPENLMIDTRGFIKLIDFGTSIELKNFTNTVVGTPHYMAPEVLLGQGYSFSCDYWSIGIIFFELLFNCYPFGDKAVDPIDVYKETFKKELEFPSTDNSIANGLIAKLLKKKVSERSCSMNAIKHDVFFGDFKWNELVDMSIESPFQPASNTLRRLSDYNCLYLDQLENEQNRIKSRFEASESSVEERDGEDSNRSVSSESKKWIDEF